VRQVLDRGEKIELLVDKTEDLRSHVSLICFALTSNQSVLDMPPTSVVAFVCRHKTSRSRE
jgi:hypothetical protein